MTEFFVDGWTLPIEYQLLSCGEPVNLTGGTVTLQAYGVGDVALTMAGTVVVTSSTGGKVEFRPAAADLSQARGDVLGRFKIVDASSKVSFCPSCEAEQWVVRRM